MFNLFKTKGIDDLVGGIEKSKLDKIIKNVDRKVLDLYDVYPILDKLNIIDLLKDGLNIFQVNDYDNRLIYYVKDQETLDIFNYLGAKIDLADIKSGYVKVYKFSYFIFKKFWIEIKELLQNGNDEIYMSRLTNIEILKFLDEQNFDLDAYINQNVNYIYCVTYRILENYINYGDDFSKVEELLKIVKPNFNIINKYEIENVLLEIPNYAIYLSQLFNNNLRYSNKNPSISEIKRDLKRYYDVFGKVDFNIKLGQGKNLYFLALLMDKERIYTFVEFLFDNKIDSFEKDENGYSFFNWVIDNKTNLSKTLNFLKKIEQNDSDTEFKFDIKDGIQKQEPIKIKVNTIKATKIHYLDVFPMMYSNKSFKTFQAFGSESIELADKNIIKFRSDSKNIFILDKSGNLFGFGNNLSAIFGDGTLNDHPKLELIRAEVKDFECIFSEMFVLTKDGKLYKYGIGKSQRLIRYFNRAFFKQTKVTNDIDYYEMINNIKFASDEDKNNAFSREFNKFISNFYFKKISDCVTSLSREYNDIIPYLKVEEDSESYYIDYPKDVPLNRKVDVNVLINALNENYKVEQIPTLIIDEYYVKEEEEIHLEIYTGTFDTVEFLDNGNDIDLNIYDEKINIINHYEEFYPILFPYFIYKKNGKLFKLEDDAFDFAYQYGKKQNLKSEIICDNPKQIITLDSKSINETFGIEADINVLYYLENSNLFRICVVQTGTHGDYENDGIIFKDMISDNVERIESDNCFIVIETTKREKLVVSPLYRIIKNGKILNLNQIMKLTDFIFKRDFQGSMYFELEFEDYED